MTQQTETQAEGGIARGLATIVALLAVVIGVPAWLIAGAAAGCGCTQPADLVVYNASGGGGLVAWTTPGLLGTPFLAGGGETDVAACTTRDLVLPEGAVHVTIAALGQVAGLDTVVPDAHGGRIPHVAIAKDGTMRILTGPPEADALPETGDCAP